MPIFAFHDWLSKFRIWSYLHHTNVSDKQRKTKQEDFNLVPCVFVYIYVLLLTKFNLYKISIISYA